MSTIDISHVRALDDDALDTLFRKARTANSFSEKPLDDATLHELYELSKFGPTALNSQPMRLIFVRTPEAKQRLAPYLSPGNRDKSMQAPVTAIVAADRSFHETLDRTFPHFVGAKDSFADEGVRESSATFNAALQMGYLIMAARSLGLVAGPMGGFDSDGVTTEFLNGTDYYALSLVNLGYPGENPWMQRLPRLDFEEVAQII